MEQLLNYKEYGSGPPLVILHGLLGTGDNWNTIAKQLAEQYRVIVPDMRNHGRSFHSTAHSLGHMAADIVVLLNHLEIPTAFILGHSMGGKVAMEISLTSPQRCSGLIVVDIAPRGYERGHDQIFAALAQSDPIHAADRKTIQFRLHKVLNDEGVEYFLMKSLVRNSEDQPGFHWRFNYPVLYNNYENIIGRVWSTTPYSGPVLFIRGSKSCYILDSDWPEIKKIFPQAILQEVQNAGHWVHADQPGQVILLIKNFLENEG